MVESGIFYATILDPILATMRKRLAIEVSPKKTIIDIACGTGAQLFEIAAEAEKVTGVDLSESMIRYAQKAAKKKGISNAEFMISDATRLAQFEANSFDVAILSLALHQFSPDLYSPILCEMRRLAKVIILLDYTVPLPTNFVGMGSRIAEFLAGREHHRNFKSYYQLGGLNEILPANNLSIKKSRFMAGGSFQLVVCGVE